MSDAKITCPKCRAEVALTESLAGPLLERTRREAEAAQVGALAAQKAAIEAQAMEAAAARQATRMAEIEEAAATREAELAALRERDGLREAKLAAAQEAQAEAVALRASLAEEKREMALTIETAVADRTEAARAKLTEEAGALAAERLRAAEEAAALKLSEKDRQMETMKRTIEELQRKAEQGSQQRQGEAAEVLLEDRLARAFPGDTVTEVGKGARGADCLLTVAGPVGPAGSILWESKRTQNWSPGWLPKLREDMREAGADVAVLTATARPEGVDVFALVDGIWVCAPPHAVALASVLREGLLAAAAARGLREGQATKTEMLYDYLTGPQFRARVEAVAERMAEMRAGLAQEKKTMLRHWAAREKQIDTAFGAMVGIYGDVQGIAGASSLQIAALEEPGALEE